jgi:hypothetical protein
MAHGDAPDQGYGVRGPVADCLRAGERDTRCRSLKAVA